MTSDPDVERAESWIVYWRRYEATGKLQDGLSGQFVDLPRNDPEGCWRFIGHVLDRIEAKLDDSPFQVLAAGPLEDLLDLWGKEVIDRVEARAANDPRFKLLLGGVWRSIIDGIVWERVEGCRGEPW